MNTTTILNTVSYNGTVDIKLQRNGKQYKLQTHNTGTTKLTELIVRALCGQNVTNSIPRYLNMVVIKNSNTLEESRSSLLKYNIPFTGITWGDVVKTKDNGSAMLLTATILPDDKLSQLNVDALPIELQMRNVNDEVLATIRSTDSDTSLHDLYNSLDNGTSGIIEWCMEFNI